MVLVIQICLLLIEYIRREKFYFTQNCFQSFVIPSPNGITDDREHDFDNDDFKIGIIHEQYEHLLGI